jgi:hypothetical protein
MLNRQAVGCVPALFLVLIGAPAVAEARDLYVDPQVGDDTADGSSAKPVKTIARGIKLAGPGDTVHLATATYFEPIVFYNRHGEPGRPITLDGHGSTVEGAPLIKPADWQQVSPGLYRNDKLMRPDLITRDDAVIGRWFFTFDGKINHMGRTSKGKSASLKQPADLEPGEWTIGKAEHAFYVRIDPAKQLDDCRIGAPIVGSGIIVAGDCAHLVVRNVTCQHVYNDGINIHGKTRDTLFQEITARECGDDGCSAHDDCQIRVDGFRSIGNSTGICNTGHSTSENRRVLIADCLGFDFYALDEGFSLPSGSPSSSHTLTDSVIRSSAARCIQIDGSRGIAEPCRVKMENVRIERIGKTDEIRVTKHAELTATNVDFLNVKLQVTGGTVDIRRSVFGWGDIEVVIGPGSTWRADHNYYMLSDITFQGKEYPFAEYQKVSDQDQHSTIAQGTVENPPSEVGTDESRLPKHEE